MSDEEKSRIHTLEDIYALIDQNRADAARAAHVKFLNDVGAAIATIGSISSVASARVQADSRVASAKVLINAEIAATRLLAEAEIQASKCAEELLTRPKAEVEAAILEIGKLTTWRLTANARESVEAIQKDAEAAISILKDTGANAIREIQTYATDVTTQARREAKLAAARLKAYRQSGHSKEQASADGDDAAEIVIRVAEEAAAQLQRSLEVTLAQLHAVTDEACLAVQEAALAAEKRIAEGQERALARLKEAIELHTRG